MVGMFSRKEKRKLRRRFFVTAKEKGIRGRVVLGGPPFKTRAEAQRVVSQARSRAQQRTREIRSSGRVVIKPKVTDLRVATGRTIGVSNLRKRFLRRN